MGSLSSFIEEHDYFYSKPLYATEGKEISNKSELMIQYFNFNLQQPQHGSHAPITSLQGAYYKIATGPVSHCAFQNYNILVMKHEQSRVLRSYLHLIDISWSNLVGECSGD